MAVGGLEGDEGGRGRDSISRPARLAFGGLRGASHRAQNRGMTTTGSHCMSTTPAGLQVVSP